MKHTVMPATTELLKQYEQYKLLREELQATTKQLAKQKLLKLDSDELQVQYNEQTDVLQKLSDAMTFDSPLIWIEYKTEAYRDETQPILTMHDLRLHCSKVGYICTKRYTFLNDQLLARGNSALSDTKAFPDATDLRDILLGESLVDLTHSETFMRQWRTYEYNTVQGRVAKWENYSKTSK